MSLRKFCVRPVVTVDVRASITEACRLMRDRNIGCLVAVEGGKLSGILTDRDIALRVTGEGDDPTKTKVGEVMTSNPVRVSVDKDLDNLTALMHTHHVRRVPIVDGVDEVVGIVTLDDLIAVLREETWDIAEAISEPYVGPT